MRETLSKETLKKIANRIRQEFDPELIYDKFSIWKYLKYECGFHIIQESELPVAGFIYSSSSKILICCRKEDSYTRKRFTLAHELGHYLLHTDEKFECSSDINDSSSPEEIEANRFAAYLLVPDHLLKKVYERYKHLDDCIDYLAVKFGASRSTIKIRLSEIFGEKINFKVR